MDIEIDTSNLKIEAFINGEMDERITQALTKAALVVEAAAKEKAPVDTGNLRGSITHDVEKNIATIGTNVEYAPYVEKGTGVFAKGGRANVPWSYEDASGKWHKTNGIKAQPFLEPALKNNTSKILKCFEGAFE